jgi:hypothetical protein
MTDVFPGATLVQLVEWGYPMGSRRPAPSPANAFSVVHITANTAPAENEAAWRLNDTGLQNSATVFINQDGSIVQTLGDPLYMDPWTNGDVQNPDMSNPRIAAMVRDGVNANERSLVTLENVGREPGMPITAAQEAACAAIIAYYHAKIGLPVNRETVVGHYQINSVNRPNCPSVNKSVIDRIVALANGAIPEAGGEPDVSTSTRIYPAPRTWTTKGGNLTGYIDSDAPNITVAFSAGSPALASAEVTISPAYPGWPDGPYQRVLDGPLAGHLVANSQVNLGPEPVAETPTPAPAPVGLTRADVEAIVKAAVDPLVVRIEELVAAEKATAEDLDRRLRRFEDIE